ncbi:uncharacterized protein C8orf76 isoform X2 [Lampris incognitus]|uniref:uncharacterized protein C8orf76 isoform X2 n=1 Tax=Lampris incognitus TaxID=2546036 RepID=UPI0024B55331|nr:uncharacterized protein C8orf76 isoform X2 [Lampris incognitus]
MEIFGSTFDDSVFVETRDRVSITLSSYNAKLCEPQSALDAYSSCLEWIPDNNLTIRRDVLEGMARCFTNLGQREKAMEMADLLSSEASNTCHLTSLLQLKVSIYQHFGAIGAKIVSLQQLCSLLPFNPWHWYSLGQTCIELLETDEPQGSYYLQKCDSTEEQNDRQTGEQQDEDEEEERDRIWLKACMCFIRTRLLLRILRQQQSSFVLQRSKSVLQRTDEVLQQLNPKADTLQTLTEVMSEDLIPEKMREDNQDGESLAGLCQQSFQEHWWNKLLLTGVLETDGPQHQTQTEAKP